MRFSEYLRSRLSEEEITLRNPDDGIEYRFTNYPPRHEDHDFVLASSRHGLSQFPYSELMNWDVVESVSSDPAQTPEIQAAPSPQSPRPKLIYCLVPERLFFQASRISGYVLGQGHTVYQAGPNNGALAIEQSDEVWLFGISEETLEGTVYARRLGKPVSLHFALDREWRDLYHRLAEKYGHPLAGLPSYAFPFEKTARKDEVSGTAQASE